MTTHEHGNIKGEGFEILGHEEAGDKEEEQATPKAEETKSEQAFQEEGAELHPIDIYVVLRFCISQLAGVAWQMMGLRADPFTNQVKKDLEQARIAIDSATVLTEKLTPHLQGQERRDFETLLTDLRINYLKQSGEGEKHSG